MKTQLVKVHISPAEGNAGRGENPEQVDLPASWKRALGILKEDRQMFLSFDGGAIVFSPMLSMAAFAKEKKAAGHQVQVFRFYDNARLCSLIYADFTDHTLQVENYTDNLVKTAFGRKELPVWEDLMDFLEDRCIPRTRAGLEEYLEALGLDEYEPLEIIRRTEGRMAEDHQWLEVEPLL